MKRLTTAITCFAFIFASTLHADEGEDSASAPPFALTDGPDAAAPAVMPDQNSTNAATEVGKGAEEGANAGKSTQWGTYAIAASAIAVAVTALILVSKNKGKSHNHSH